MDATKKEEETKVVGDAETTATESLNTSVASSNDSVEDTNEFTEEEAKNAEEYKSKGNDFFKCKTLRQVKNVYRGTF